MDKSRHLDSGPDPIARLQPNLLVAVGRAQKYRSEYTLQEEVGTGQSSVVWRAVDDLGEPVALKVMRSFAYPNSLYDEMTFARRLDSNYFARLVAFGTLEIDGKPTSPALPSVVTELIAGTRLDTWLEGHDLLVPEFMALVEQLFGALADLRAQSLCHDDLHAGNVLVETRQDYLKNTKHLCLRVIDTGSLKRISTRTELLTKLREKVATIDAASTPDCEHLRELLAWKAPDDHLRAVELLLIMANRLMANYHRFEPRERRFVDQLLGFFDRLAEESYERRLDAPTDVVIQLRALEASAHRAADTAPPRLESPFDFPSAEMILSDLGFANLFSARCPWLAECQAKQPLYLYGPRGCGKSSVLRWLSFKTLISDPSRDASAVDEVGVYVSCSSELRSRFLLLSDAALESMQARVIRFFSLLLAEELFDTLGLIRLKYGEGPLNLSDVAAFAFTKEAATRIQGEGEIVRLQGEAPFDYLKGLCRHLRWSEWSRIQRKCADDVAPDPALVSDLCRKLGEHFDFFKTRHVTFLIDDYSNQRIPVALQRKLNQTISFAKQGTPIFKVSSEYDGVDLQGIQEGREVFEVNCGDSYTSLDNSDGYKFLEDIIDRRLKDSGYVATITETLGKGGYPNMSKAIAAEKEEGGVPFYYHGIDCIHHLCSGDLALALDVVKRIFSDARVTADKKQVIPAALQHKTITQFAHEEVVKLRYIVPDGEAIFDIVTNLGYLARTCVVFKKSQRRDKPDEPSCKTHLDIRHAAIEELQTRNPHLAGLYSLLKSRAILFPLDTSRSRISGQTERLQLRRAYLPAFKAPLKRDVPVKADTADELISLLQSPRNFVEAELRRGSLTVEQLQLAIDDAVIKPRGG